MATASGNPGWINGSCNCGKITVSLKPPSDGLHVCHCIDCRKFTGAIAAFLLQLPAADFKIEGEYRTWNTIGNTGLKVGRYFCGECGSSLYDTGECDPGNVSVHGGLFPPGSLPAPCREIFLADTEKWEQRYPNAKTWESQ